MKDYVFENGQIVRDVITGFQGCVRARADYLTGCNRYGVQHQDLDKDGNSKEWQWIDENELKLVQGAETIKLVNHSVAKPMQKRADGGPLRTDQTPPR